MMIGDVERVLLIGELEAESHGLGQKCSGIMNSASFSTSGKA